MKPEVVVGLVGATVVLQRLSELVIARRNAHWVRRRGAQEFGAAHYPLFFVLHTGWLVAWPLEAWLRGPRLAEGWGVALGVFVAAELLRYWAIGSLGRRWNTRILVLPGEPLVREGPYRLLAHPNYVAVVLEVAAVPLMFGAWWTASVVSLLNLGLLLGVRIPAENRALAHASASGPSPTTGRGAPEDRPPGQG